MIVKNKFILFIISFLLCIISSNSIAQEIPTDTISTDTVKEHSPRKATIYSAILPGLGQAYNEKYWKIPVIYGVFATTGYFMISNFNEYNRYRDAYRIRFDDDPNSIDEFDGKYGDESLKGIRDYYRRNFELMIVASVAIYAINIIDASVDAHLKDFEVNDDISLHFSPNLFYSSLCVSPTLKLTIKLK